MSEACLIDSALVLVFEGGLYNVVNGGHAARNPDRPHGCGRLIGD